MNAIRNIYDDDEKNQGNKTNLTVISKETKETKEDVKYSKEYLNEKMYYFYNNGGPAMDI